MKKIPALAISLVVLVLLFGGCAEQNSAAPAAKKTNDVPIEKVIRNQQHALSEQQTAQLNQLDRDARL